MGLIIEKYELRRWFGFFVFVALLLLKVYYFIGKVIHDIMGLFWQQILPWGIFIATILIIVLAIIIIFAVIFSGGAVLRFIPSISRLFGRSVATTAEGAVVQKGKKIIEELDQRRKEANARADGETRGRRVTSNRNF